MTNPESQKQNATQIVQQFIGTHNLPWVVQALKAAKVHYIVQAKKEIAEQDLQDQQATAVEFAFNLIYLNQLTNFIDVLHRYPQDAAYFTQQFLTQNLIEILDVVQDANMWLGNTTITEVVQMVIALKKLSVNNFLTLSA